MKVSLHYVAVGACRLIDFADRNELELEISERASWHRLSPFHASFKDVEIKGDGVLIGCSGNGRSPQEAVNDLASRIAGRRLVFDAYGARREFDAPNDWLDTRIPELDRL